MKRNALIPYKETNRRFHLHLLLFDVFFIVKVTIISQARLSYFQAGKGPIYACTHLLFGFR